MTARELCEEINIEMEFRQVVFHSYVFQVDWDRMEEGIVDIEDVYLRFKAKLNEYLKTLMPEEE